MREFLSLSRINIYWGNFSDVKNFALGEYSGNISALYHHSNVNVYINGNINFYSILPKFLQKEFLLNEYLFYNRSVASSHHLHKPNTIQEKICTKIFLQKFVLQTNFYYPLFIHNSKKGFSYTQLYHTDTTGGNALPTTYPTLSTGFFLRDIFPESSTNGGTVMDYHIHHSSTTVDECTRCTIFVLEEFGSEHAYPTNSVQDFSKAEIFLIKELAL